MAGSIAIAGLTTEAAVEAAAAAHQAEKAELVIKALETAIISTIVIEAGKY